jgi:putative ABC transport system ATP-binding protein
VAIVELHDVWKTYQMGAVDVHALRGANLAVEEGELVSIMGPSGSGKSTLLNLVGCLDRPTGGSYILDDRDVSDLSDADLSEVRSGQIGFIFQSYNLIPQLNVIENIEIPLFYQGLSERASYERAVDLGERVGLGDRLQHHPPELSGGQRQRVGVARALANNPAIVLADEPTGNLDTETGEEILKLLLSLNRDYGTTLLLVTHDPDVADTAHRTVHMVDGQLTDGRVAAGGKN